VIRLMPMGNPGPRTVLVVDDEELILDFVKLTLKHAGHAVLMAGHSKDALAIANSHMGPIDLALLDISLPGIGGGELGQALREILPNLPIIFMTGFADDDLQRFGVDEPNSDVLLKPFLSRQLTDKVHEVMARAGTMRASANPSGCQG
jgi:two-component system, cell cycle sensor histidine kinase and response regulator CckA